MVIGLKKTYEMSFPSVRNVPLTMSNMAFRPLVYLEVSDFCRIRWEDDKCLHVALLYDIRY